jgi:type II secretory pathway pseudopilin PulG
MAVTSLKIRASRRLHRILDAMRDPAGGGSLTDRRPVCPQAQNRSLVAGFSLIEALVVLLVAGMALMLVFSIGGQSARTGFSLGRRALAAADDEVTQDQLRSLIRDLTPAPIGVDPAPSGLAPFVGDASGFQGDAVLHRAGVCGDAGPAGHLRVAIESHADGDVVSCQVGAAAPRTVADLRPRRVRFAYSTDGVRWSDGWRAPAVARAPIVGPTRPIRSPASVFIRLASDDGRIELVERANSGPPWLFPQETGRAPTARALNP